MKIGPIFVIGGGRTGTNLVGRILASHPEIRCTIEDRVIFPLAVACSKDPSRIDDLMELYRLEIAKSAPRRYADKSHTNLWLVDELANRFSDAQFVATRRGLLSTVSSMIRHPAFVYGEWQPGYTPSYFVGDYHRCTQLQRCVLRYLAIEERVDILDGIHIVEFESLVMNPTPTIAALLDYLELRTPIPIPKLDTATLTKWQVNLADAELVQQFHDAVVQGRDAAR